MKLFKRSALKKTIIGSAATALVITTMISTQLPNHAEAAPKLTKNVILFIGDGMGLAHRDAIRLATVGLTGKLAMDDMPYAGLIHTSSTINVTDSAAAATAFASGVKTYNGAIGMD